MVLHLSSKALSIAIFSLFREVESEYSLQFEDNRGAEEVFKRMKHFTR